MRVLSVYPVRPSCSRWIIDSVAQYSEYSINEWGAVWQTYMAKDWRRGRARASRSVFLHWKATLLLMLCLSSSSLSLSGCCDCWGWQTACLCSIGGLCRAAREVPSSIWILNNKCCSLWALGWAWLWSLTHFLACFRVTMTLISG